MSVSKTSFSDPGVPSGVGDDLDIPPDRLPLPGGRLPTYKPPSKFSIEAIVCSYDPAHNDKKAATRISDTGASSMSALRPSMIPGMPATNPKRALPQELPQEPSSREFRQPIATGIAPPANNYPSSYPVLKRYPIPPYQPQETVAPASQTHFHPMPSTTNQSPALWSERYGSLVTTQAPFDLPFDFRQPTTTKLQPTTSNQQGESLPDMGDERPPKRRRSGEGSDSTTTNSSGQTAELPIWHESRLEPNEDPTPYMEFLGLTDTEGKDFVEKIFSSNHHLKRGGTYREYKDFLEKLFTRLSSALEKRRLGTTQISDDQLGKLVVSSFLLTKKISKYLENNFIKNKSLINIADLVISFVNKNHCIASYLKRGIKFDDKTSHFLFSGKNKLELMLWCAEQSISLNQEELNYLSTDILRVRTLDGPDLLKELRKRVKEQQKNATS
jgi:hypothetical protein